ncbi:MAG: hypothetical protein LBM77_03700 [Spirochaetaceae bacterium]|jgi:hypothetical protein|nr:hypothetical protein [Spirochaetaceae bacterium]
MYIKRLCLTIILFFSFFLGFAFAQDAEVQQDAGTSQPEASTANNAITLFTDTTQDASAISPALVNAISTIEDYNWNLVSRTLPDPGIPPSASLARNASYVITTAFYQDLAAGETHMQLWLYDMTDDKLIITDEMLYATLDEATEFLPGLLQYIVSQIPINEEEKAQAQTAEEAAPEEETEAETTEETNEEVTEEKDYGKWYIAAGYAPLAPITGYYADMLHDSFLTQGYMLSGMAIPWSGDWGGVGFKLQMIYNPFTVTAEGKYGILYPETSGTHLAANLYAVYQLPRLNWLEFDIQLGGGLTPVIGFVIGDHTTQSTFGLSANIGLELRFLIAEHFSISLGADAIVAFDDGFRMFSIMPSAQLGWKF